jgi:hypothetical protein
MRKRYLFVIVLSLVLFHACSDPKKPYRFERNFTHQQRDTLLVDMVTLIGKKPKTADYISRHEPRFREYYNELSKEFSMEYFYHVDDTCYYYMIRPARSARGNTRGVGGKLTLDQEFRIDYFEESFNTPIYPREDLERIGWRLFRELIEKRSIEGLLWNVDYIEWPDDRLKYDLEKREWRYDVVDGKEEIFDGDQ